MEYKKCIKYQGAEIRKAFLRSGKAGKKKYHYGTVSYIDLCMDDNVYKCLIRYQDGDEEHMTADEVSEHIVKRRKK